MNFISMAYLEGRICLDHEGQFKTSAGSGVEICDERAACGLAAAHAEDVIHRDLKPQNILVDKNDQINVADFGLARSFAEGAVGMIHGGAFRAPLTEFFNVKKAGVAVYQERLMLTGIGAPKVVHGVAFDVSVVSLKSFAQGRFDSGVVGEMIEEALQSIHSRIGDDRFGGG